MPPSAYIHFKFPPKAYIYFGELPYGLCRLRLSDQSLDSCRIGGKGDQTAIHAYTCRDGYISGRKRQEFRVLWTERDGTGRLNGSLLKNILTAPDTLILRRHGHLQNLLYRSINNPFSEILLNNISVPCISHCKIRAREEPHFQENEQVSKKKRPVIHLYSKQITGLTGLVGAVGFEPTTSCSRSMRADRAALRPDVLHILVFKNNLAAQLSWPIKPFKINNESIVTAVPAIRTPITFAKTNFRFDSPRRYAPNAPV